ncbi:acyloxyacyl hydrolase [Kineobactrum sediminis]|nr:acyloxyacyl hydrolase [Kineobactrum sediminis]
MRNTINSVVFVCAVIGTLPVSVGASPPEPGRMLNLSVGQLGIDRRLNNRGLYGAELRLQPIDWYQLVPSIGLAASETDAGFVYVDVKKDFFLSPHWYVTPAFGVGIFNETREFRLGHSLEFRSGMEAGYRFDNHYRLGLAVFHLSNGGLSEENPGTEIVVLSLSIPL